MYHNLSVNKRAMYHEQGVHACSISVNLGEVTSTYVNTSFGRCYTSVAATAIHWCVTKYAPVGTLPDDACGHSYPQTSVETQYRSKYAFPLSSPMTRAAAAGFRGLGKIPKPLRKPIIFAANCKLQPQPSEDVSGKMKLPL